MTSAATMHIARGTVLRVPSWDGTWTTDYQWRDLTWKQWDTSKPYAQQDYTIPVSRELEEALTALYWAQNNYLPGPGEVAPMHL